MSNKRYVRVRIKTWYVCGCVDCRGHDGVTVKQVELPVADLSSGEIDRVVRHHFVDEVVLSWQLWSEADYMRAIGAVELPFMVQP